MWDLKASLSILELKMHILIKFLKKQRNVLCSVNTIMSDFMQGN